MVKKKINSINLKANNNIAFLNLIIPCVLLIFGLLISINGEGLLYWLGQFLLSIFFLQTFILLHECAHLSFFKSHVLNRIIGHIFGFLSFILFYSWQQMHNLHHRWTGWRDKDPTTETTVSPSSSKAKNAIVNLAWKLCIPVFYLSYKFSNYWNVWKIKRFLNPKKYRKAKIQILLYLMIYSVLIFFFLNVIIHFFLYAFLVSLLWKELVIMTQHTHIDIPVANNKEVKPISYINQVQYTRSFYSNTFFTRYFLFNFNLHQAHHAYPGIPAYRLSNIELELPQKPQFINWLYRSKKMKGVDYIFRTSKHTCETFD